MEKQPDDCAVCLEETKELQVVTLQPCKHCIDCVKKLFSCTLCRSNITDMDPKLVCHTMSEPALIIPKSPKSFDYLEFFFMHWTKLFPKN